MKLKEGLNQIKSKHYELKALAIELDALRDRALGDGSPKIDKLNVMTSLPQDSMAEAVTEYEDLLKQYTETKRVYKAMLLYYKSVLRRLINNNDTYNIMAMKYFEFMSYGEIGAKYGMNYQQCKRFISVTLKDLEMCYK